MIDVKLQMNNCTTISWRDQVTINDMMMICALEQDA